MAVACLQASTRRRSAPSMPLATRNLIRLGSSISMMLAPEAQFCRTVAVLERSVIVDAVEKLPSTRGAAQAITGVDYADTDKVLPGSAPRFRCRVTLPKRAVAILFAPRKHQVRVHVVSASDDRHRLAGAKRLFHNPPLQVEWIVPRTPLLRCDPATRITLCLHRMSILSENGHAHRLTQTVSTLSENGHSHSFRLLARRLQPDAYACSLIFITGF